MVIDLKDFISESYICSCEQIDENHWCQITIQTLDTLYWREKLFQKPFPVKILKLQFSYVF